MGPEFGAEFLHMPGSITPLPVMLEEEQERQAKTTPESPKTIVVRYGYQKLIAELPYRGPDRPGCGSRLVIRTKRGIELAEMLTSTCPNSGCAKSVSRQQMMSYIENSGGKDYPFSTKDTVLHIASVEDINEQARLDANKPRATQLCKQLIGELDLSMRLVDIEFLLGGDQVIFHYTAEKWVDFRELVRKLAAEMQTRIEMHQVNAREEARLVADYEKCGQYCCCKQFLKVLKPVSMRLAKVQKATLDPHKISGRCGRLMCCLRYEDQTYSDLKKRLPSRKSFVETEDGVGQVLDNQILTQLVLVKIGVTAPAAYPVENIRVLSNDEAKQWAKEQREQEKSWQERGPRRKRSEVSSGDKPAGAPPTTPKPDLKPGMDTPTSSDTPAPPVPEGQASPSKRRRRRKRRRKHRPDGGAEPGGTASSPD